jgi:8-oxo-dGTP pyrophosphatase MutT (NUDIX family)
VDIVTEPSGLGGPGPDPERPWQVLESTTLIDSPWLRVERQRIRTDSGYEIPEYYLLNAPDIVIVLPLTVDHQAILVRQYRPGPNRTVLELPAGMLETSDASPAVAAERELLEETGYRPGRIEPLGDYYPSLARQRNQAHCFLALDCQQVAAPAGDPAESIAVSLLSLGELRTTARSGGLPSAASLSCLFLGLERLAELGLA